MQSQICGVILAYANEMWDEASGVPEYDRTVESMVDEWSNHNFIAIFTKGKDGHSGDADFNNAAEGDSLIGMYKEYDAQKKYEEKNT